MLVLRDAATRGQTILTVPDKLKAAALYENLTPAELIEHALRRGEGVLGRNGQFIVDTRPHTGRSPKDKAFVKEPSSEEHIDWGDTNAPVEESVFDALWDKVQAYLSERDVYSLDCYVGADENYRVPVRVYTEFAWHNLFAHHLFITPDTPAPEFSPEFTVVDAALFQADPQRDGTRSSTFILVNFEKRMILIGGTKYAGEIKKSVFTVMNYLLPLRETLPMHCSANVGKDGDVAIFFGLSGTGKTTLSSDAHRPLIGDDEHGWSNDGVFNFEGGCYAKVIKLSPTAEPEIWAATTPFFNGARERRVRRNDARTRRGLGREDRKHALCVSDRVHPEHRSRKPRRPPQDHHHADSRRLRRLAADLANSRASKRCIISSPDIPRKSRARSEELRNRRQPFPLVSAHRSWSIGRPCIRSSWARRSTNTKSSAGS